MDITSRAPADQIDALAPTTPMADNFPPATTAIGLGGPLRIGQVFAGHRLDHELGRGGMGVVYHATHVTLDRPAALKVRLDQHDDPVGLARFVREAKAAAKVRHANVVAVLDAGEQNGLPYLILEFVPGGSLHDRLRQHPKGLPICEALALIRDAAAGLAAVHAAGLLHRDVKPANILIDHDGTAKIADFGLAKPTQASVDLTGAGFVGTPRYLAPEVVQSRGFDARSDVYALGLTLYELLTGRSPFRGETPLNVLYAIVHSSVPNVRSLRSELSPLVAELVARAMHRNPDHRIASAEALVTALETCLKTLPATQVATPHAPTRNWRKVVAVALVLILIAVVGIIFFRSTPNIEPAPALEPHIISLAIADKPSVAIALPPAPIVKVVNEQIVGLKHSATVPGRTDLSVFPSPSIPAALTAPPASVTVPSSVIAGHSAVALTGPPGMEPAVAIASTAPAITRVTPPETSPQQQIISEPPAVLPPKVATAPELHNIIPIESKPVKISTHRPGQDPFIDDFLGVGWRQIHAQAQDGLFAADGRLVAWGPLGVSTSTDQGASWTKPVSLWGVNGAVPVAEAIVAGDQTWIRCVDGSLRVLGEPQSRNHQLRLQAVSRVMSCGGEMIAIENGGSEVCLIAHGVVMGRAPGRLAAALIGGVAVDDGQVIRWLTPRGVVAVDRPFEVLGEPPLATGPASTSAISSTGLRWQMRNGVAHGNGQIRVTVRAFGEGVGPSGIEQVGLIDDPDRGSMVVGITGRQDLTVMDATADLPAGITAIASCGRDRLNTTRIRLVAVGAGGCWIYRCR